MLKADEIKYNQTEINGKWVIAKPIMQPFVMRLKDAIKVLNGKAEAIEFYKQ
jgi:hypothetical protein